MIQQSCIARNRYVKVKKTLFFLAFPCSQPRYTPKGVFKVWVPKEWTTALESTQGMVLKTYSTSRVINLETANEQYGNKQSVLDRNVVKEDKETGKKKKKKLFPQKKGSVA